MGLYAARYCVETTSFMTVTIAIMATMARMVQTIPHGMGLLIVRCGRLSIPQMISCAAQEQGDEHSQHTQATAALQKNDEHLITCR